MQMVETTLITGVTGFVGSHLLDLLGDKGESEIYGIIRENSSLDRIRDNESNIKLITCDLQNKQRLSEVIENVRPNEIYHLAGQSSVQESWKSINPLVHNNIVATVNLLEVIKGNKHINPNILLACSSEEYGLVSDHSFPIDEKTPLILLVPMPLLRLQLICLVTNIIKGLG